MLVIAALAIPALALAQDKAPLPEKKAAKPAAAKPAAKPGAVATVNGVAVPQARMDLLIQQQQQRGAPDNEQLRNMVKDELVNREVIAQEAQKTGVGKIPEVAAQI